MRHAGVIGWKYVTKKKKLKGNRSKVGQDTCGSHGPSYSLCRRRERGAAAGRKDTSESDGFGAPCG